MSGTQIPLLPHKQGTLHGVQGNTADPGFIAHWKFPKGLKWDSIWLAYYVSLSRPRSLSRLLSHGMPYRSIIKGGPPESITDAFRVSQAGLHRGAPQPAVAALWDKQGGTSMARRAQKEHR